MIHFQVFYNSRNWASLLLIGMVSMILSGCEEAGPKMFPVSGTVTWQGQALPTGQIVFLPLDKNVPGSSGNIEQGKFFSKASAGKTQVQIFAFRPAATVDNVMGQAPQEQYLPVHYNDQTTLSVDVSPTGPNQFTFDLTDTPNK
jgi:hypothetical protein